MDSWLTLVPNAARGEEALVGILKNDAWGGMARWKKRRKRESSQRRIVLRLQESAFLGSSEDIAKIKIECNLVKRSEDREDNGEQAGRALLRELPTI